MEVMLMMVTNRQRVGSWCAAMLVVLAAFGCTTPLETVKLPGAGPAWHTVHMQDFGEGKGTLTELVPVGQELGNWTHMLTIEFLEATPLTLDQWMAARHEAMAGLCPDVIWTVLSQDQFGITYEWRVDNCAGRSDQHELVRLLRGNDGLHRASYTEKSARMDPKSRALWLSRLNNAVVIKGDDMEKVQVL